MTTLQRFKDEFRTMCTSTWDDSVEAWFEAVAQLYDRGCEIPTKYKYQPAKSLVNQSDNESYWCNVFCFLTTEELGEIAEYLYRYCSYLRFKGVDN